MSQTVLDSPGAAVADEVVDDGVFTLDLRRVLKLNDEKFLTLCADNGDLRFEMNAEGELLIMSPSDWVTSVRNGKITKQLTIWAEEDDTGIATESSGGFTFPNKAKRGPDAAWISRERLQQLRPEEKKGLLPLCPEFVIELRSSRDSLNKLKAKMEEYISQGVLLGWLIDPKDRRVYVYRPNRPVEVLHNIPDLAADPELPGFVLNLREVWDPKI